MIIWKINLKNHSFSSSKLIPDNGAAAFTSMQITVKNRHFSRLKALQDQSPVTQLPQLKWYWLNCLYFHFCQPQHTQGFLLSLHSSSSFPSLQFDPTKKSRRRQADKQATRNRQEQSLVFSFIPSRRRFNCFWMPLSYVLTSVSPSLACRMSERQSFVFLPTAALTELSWEEGGSWREQSPLVLCRGTRHCRRFGNEAALILPEARLDVLQTFECCLQRRQLQTPSFMFRLTPTPCNGRVHQGHSGNQKLELLSSEAV